MVSEKEFESGFSFSFYYFFVTFVQNFECFVVKFLSY